MILSLRGYEPGEMPLVFQFSKRDLPTTTRR
jgi:hypothetical protein